MGREAPAAADKSGLSAGERGAFVIELTGISGSLRQGSFSTAGE
jgi:hypothetical protein